MARKQIINPLVGFAQRSIGPYANKLGGGAYARAITQGQRGNQRFGVVNLFPPNVNNRAIQEGEDWSLWTTFTSGTGSVVLSGTNNGIADCTCATGDRAWLGESHTVEAGRTYAVSFEVTAIGANPVPRGILVTGAAPTSGDKDVDITSVGWWAVVFTSSSSQTVNARMGVGTGSSAANAQSLTISQPMFQDITDYAPNFSAYTRTKTTTAWDPGNTVSGSSGLVNEAQGAEIPPPYNDYTDCMGVGDSFANESDEWPTLLEDIIEGLVRGDGYSGGKLTGGGGIADNFDELLAVGDYTCAIVQGGVNDVSAGVSLASMQTAVIGMKAQCDAKPCKMIMVNIAPWGNNAGWNTTKQSDQEAYNDWLASWCPANGVALADIYAALGDDADPKDLAAAYDSGDGLHPNQAGSQKIADTIKAKMR